MIVELGAGSNGTATIWNSISNSLASNITVASSFTDITGTSGADSLKGNNLFNEFNGGAGNDRIYGGAGNDFVDGRIGQDILTGGAGDDVFFITHPTSNFKTADRITDFITAKENDTLFLGKGVSKVWYRHQDVDGDGILDTVLFRQDENAQMTGIYAIIDDFSTILTGQNFENEGLVITEVV